MGPARGFPFRLEIVQVTPGEGEQLRRGTLKLNWGDMTQRRRLSAVTKARAYAVRARANDEAYVASVESRRANPPFALF